MAQLVLNDGAATPVAHTYSVVKAEGGVGYWAESIGSDLKNPKLSVGLRKIKVNGTQSGVGVNQVYREALSLVLPITGIAAGTGREELLRTLSAKVELNLPDTSTEAERDDLVALVISALTNATVKQVPKKLVPMF
mgnify:CR=1 FL=1